MAVQGGGLVLALAAAALSSRPSDWQPLWLLATLTRFAMASMALPPRVRGVRVTGAFSALVLSMVLLGPAPAVLIGLISSVVVSLHPRRLAPRYMLSNGFTHVTFPLAGGLLARWAEPHATTDVTFALMVFGVFAVTHFLNFVLIWGYLVGAGERTWRAGFVDVYARVLGVEIATALLVVGVAWLNWRVGPGATVTAGIVVLLFQWMLRTALQAGQRGEGLARRTRQLAALQFGLISTTMKTLTLRDHMTARHSAA